MIKLAEGIPKSWGKSTIGKIALIHGGKPAPQNPSAFVSNGIPFVRMKDLGRYHLTKNLEKVDSYLDPEFISDRKILPIKAGAILMPRSGSVALNHRAILGVDAVIVSHICAVEITDPNILNVFLYRYLCRIRMDKITKKTTGLDAVNFSDLRKIEVPVPPIEEQRKIVAILDKADAIRRKREQALKLADDFLRSLFLDMFGDPVDPELQSNVSSIGIECNLFAGNSLPLGEEFEGQQGGLLLLKVSDLNSPGNENVIQSARLWSSDSKKVRRSLIVPKGAIVFPKRGGAIATNKKRILGRHAVLDPNLMAVAPKKTSSINFRYLRNWFGLLDLTSISSGSSVPQLNKKDLEPLKIVIPSLKQLEMFELIAMQIADTRQKTRSELSTASSLFASLSQRAFRGEL